MYFLGVNKNIKQRKTNMKKLLDPILILLLSITTALILKSSITNNLETLRHEQKQFEETYQK